tara:strand:- start:2198 stop:2509 length:312 start_codon:yes stop_codon:yes gene_type:complete
MSSKKNIIRKSKPKKDIGNLNNKEFGVELDPTNNLCLAEDADKGQQAYYKGSKMSYTDYISEVGDRINKGKKGKGTSNIGTFAGFGEGTLNKAIKERLKDAKR